MNEFEGVFDEDYLYFYEEMLAERTDDDVELVASLIGRDDVDVLDCPCGHGRISNRLAERGYRVTGLDYTELFLEHARADAEARGVDVEYVHGDMRELPWRDRFDVLVNWFTSFGYFDDDTNRAVLRGFHDALRPGGRLLMELLNPARILANYQPTHDVGRTGGDLMIDRVELDIEESRTHTERIVIRDNRVRRAYFAVRMYWYTELRDLLLATGFENVRPGIEPSPANRLVVVADRPGP